LAREVSIWLALEIGRLTDLPIRQAFKDFRRLRTQLRKDGPVAALRRLGWSVVF